MANNMKIKKGDSSDIFEITVEGINDYADYRAEVSVLMPKTNALVIAKYTVAPTTSKFVIAFSPAQTQLLLVGDYNVVVEIIKETAGVVEFRRELNWPLQITPSLLNN